MLNRTSSIERMPVAPIRRNLKKVNELVRAVTASGTGLFFIPTAILGMISPYSVRLLVETHEDSGQMAGLLFFVSTIGSALGTLGTSFYFVLWRVVLFSYG